MTILKIARMGHPVLARPADPVPDPTAFGVPDDSYYQGDGVELSARVSETQEVRVGFAGNRQGFQELIGALKAAIEGHLTDDRSLLEDALSLATSAIDQINAYRAEGGFERLGDRYLGDQKADFRARGVPFYF